MIHSLAMAVTILLMEGLEMTPLLVELAMILISTPMMVLTLSMTLLALTQYT